MTKEQHPFVTFMCLLASMNNALSTAATICKLPQCTCLNGNGTRGTNCHKHGDARCGSCSPGFHLFSHLCTENRCKCSNGYGATGTDCSNNGDTKCGSCSPGYHLFSDLCIGREKSDKSDFEKVILPKTVQK